MSLQHRPGCFGSPLAFNSRKRPCALCPHMAGCSVAAEARASRLAERYGIKIAMQQTRANLRTDRKTA